MEILLDAVAHTTLYCSQHAFGGPSQLCSTHTTHERRVWQGAYLEQVVGQALMGEGEGVRGLNDCVAIAGDTVDEESAL